MLTEVLHSVKLLFVVCSVCGNIIIKSCQKDFKHEKPKRFMLGGGGQKHTPNFKFIAVGGGSRKIV